MPAKSHLSLAERLDARTVHEPNTGCWLWEGPTMGWGYGSIKVGRSMRLTHRMAYEVHKGPIPDGLCVCHRCDTPACINPDHLFLGTQAENSADMQAKGRGRGPYLKGERNPSAKLSEADVLKIRERLSEGGMSKTAIGRQLGVSQQLVSAIASRQAWAHI